MEKMKRRQAIERGLVKYWTGEPCKNGHLSERYTISGACIECVTENIRRERAFIKKRRAEVAAEDSP